MCGWPEQLLWICFFQTFLFLQFFFSSSYCFTWSTVYTQALRLDDESVLDEIHLKNPESPCKTNVAAVQQAMILGLWWVLAVSAVCYVKKCGILLKSCSSSWENTNVICWTSWLSINFMAGDDLLSSAGLDLKMNVRTFEPFSAFFFVHADVWTSAEWY